MVQIKFETKNIFFDNLLPKSFENKSHKKKINLEYMNINLSLITLVYCIILNILIRK